MIDPNAFLVRGRGQIHRVPASGGGGSEAPWYADGGCNEVSLPGATDDTYIVWASTAPSVTGNGDLSGSLFAGNMYVLTFTGSGPVTLSGASILAHQVDLIYTDCA